MALLSLKVSILGGKVTKTIQFDPNTIVYDACRVVRDKIPESKSEGDPKEYGLFLVDDDPKKTGCWLDNTKTLGFYLLKSGDLLEYRKKLRPLKVRLLDDTQKTVLVDDSQPVANLMVVICAKIGITNHDEFSLVRDTGPDENKEPSTLKRKDQKMEQLKRKLKTDDDLHWVDHSKTLRELGVDEDEVLTLRRKYFFSDSNVDSRDPVQLNLLYVQARDAILNTTHPVTLDQAVQFAGLQCQIQFGDHVEGKHKGSLIELKDFLPASFCKIKNIDKRIFEEHRNFMGLSDVDAKVKYVALARSLKTYGVTFFLVKEKMKGKNKLVPRLLGITKDSVLRLDEKTKEILKVWPLTTVRRWAASPNSFTLDFGDYSDSYYSVQTPEGEQISQLIAGYIDIILKKKKAKDHLGIDGDDGATMVEDCVSPAKASILQHTPAAQPSPVEPVSVALPAVVRPAEAAPQVAVGGHMPAPKHQTDTGTLLQGKRAHDPMQRGQLHDVVSEPQRALIGSIASAQQAVKESFAHLERRAEPMILGDDPGAKKWKQCTLDTRRQQVASQLAAMNAATAHVVTLTHEQEVDQPALSSAINIITTSLPEMSKDVSTIASLMDEDDNRDKLLDAARRLCKAFSDLLNAAQPYPGRPRQELLSAATRVGETSHAVLSTIGEEEEWDKETADLLLALAKAVANAAAALILKAKNVASTAIDTDLQNRVIQAATQGAQATSQLVACAKIVAPTISDPACQEKLADASKEVGRTVDTIVTVCEEATQDDRLLGDLREAAAAVTRALSELLGQIRSGTRVRTVVHEQTLDTIIESSDALFSSTGDASEMIRQARILAKATANLIEAIKGDAERTESGQQQQRLMAAAKVLADATARLIEAAKGCASSPHDDATQMALQRAAHEVRTATDAASGNALQRKLIMNLQTSAKQTAAAATQTLAAAQSSQPYCTSITIREELNQTCEDVSRQVPSLVQSVKTSSSQMDSMESHMELIRIAEDFLVPAQRLVTTAKQTAPTVSDPPSASRLQTTSTHMATSLSELRTSIGKVRSVVGQRVEEVISCLPAIDALENELREFEDAAAAHQLRPLPGETTEVCALRLGATSKLVGSSMAQILTAASQGNREFTYVAGRDTVTSLRDFVGACRGVAACTEDPGILSSARVVMQRARQLIVEANNALNNPGDPENQQRLTMVAKSVSSSLNTCINCLPGQRDVDDTLTVITESTRLLNEQQYPYSSLSYADLQAQLQDAAARLNASTERVVSSQRGPQWAAAVKSFRQDFQDLFQAGLQLAGQTKDYDTQSRITSCLRNISVTSSKLLVSAKAFAADPSASNARSTLQMSGRTVTESINELLNVCTTSMPCQKECDNAIRAIQSVRTLLDHVGEPVNDMNYFECLESVMEHSKSLGDGMGGVAEQAKQSDVDGFCVSVRRTADSVVGLVEATAQAAYLIGASDPTSVGRRPGLVDSAQFARASHAIETACRQLTSKATDQQQVLQAATVIAKHTSSLCNACRVASAQTNNPVHKRQFVQSAKDVASATAGLVKEIKALDVDPSEENRRRCDEATRPLLHAVESLTGFASSSEFATVQARFSSSAIAAQEPLQHSGREIIDGTCHIIELAKSLCAHPKDPPTWQSLAGHSKRVSDNVKRLVTTIKEKAPGQNACEEAIQRLTQCIRQLDDAAMRIVSETDALPPRAPQDLRIYQEHMETSTQAILKTLDPLRLAGKSEAENLGRLVAQMVGYLEPLVHNAIEGANRTLMSRQQMTLLEQTKTVVEASMQLIYALKECGGNPRAHMLHSDIDEHADALRDALNDLTRTLEAAAAQLGLVTGLVETLNQAMARLDQPCIVHQDPASSVDAQTKMVQLVKEISKTAQDMVVKSSQEPQQLSNLATHLAHQYAALVDQSRQLISVTSNNETVRILAYRIRLGVQDLGKACVELTRSAGARQCNPEDSYCQREVVDRARLVNEKVSHILAALVTGSRGTQACINAASTVSGIIGDLDTTIMFATAGSLNPERPGEKFGDHREDILRTAKALVEDTKTLVAGAASSQEQLASAAESAVQTIVNLAEAVKRGAASLGSGNLEAQVMLLNAIRDVAAALGDLVQATKMAAGKDMNDPAMHQLKDSARTMVTSVTSLLKTVRAVEDEHLRGTRALEAAADALLQEIRAMDTDSGDIRDCSPEELVRATKPVTLATAKAVAAGTSGRQDDAIVAANVGRKAISDLLACCRGASRLADNEDLRRRTIDTGRDCGMRYRELLLQVHQVLENPTNEGKQGLVQMSRNIAMLVADIVSCAEALKGNAYIDPEDPTVIAETELMGAAASIEAAAKKLANLKPRQITVKVSVVPTDSEAGDPTAARPNTESDSTTSLTSASSVSRPKVADENLNFDEMILEAAKSITAATAALVRAACYAQRELVDTGKLGARPLYHTEDGQWSEGLISAARMVAAATHSLVEAANALVQGHASEERLISAARQVASSTAQLLVACKVKTGPDSPAMARLQTAGNAVKQATENLVRAAQQSLESTEEFQLVINQRMVGGMAQEIKCREEILRKERELEEAREKLAQLRKAKYGNRATDEGFGQETAYSYVYHASEQSGSGPPQPLQPISPIRTTTTTTNGDMEQHTRAYSSSSSVHSTSMQP